MNIRFFYPVFLLFFLAACNQLEVSTPSPEASDDLRPLSLEQGISPLLSEDLSKRFTSSELQELDHFLMNPYADLEIREDEAIRLPAGSADALADAVNRAPEGGTIVLASGIHTESATVMIDKKVRIVGEPGAILEVTTVPEEVAGYADPAIHIKGVAGVSISRITLQSANAIGGTAILIEDAPRTVLAGNTIIGHQYGVAIENSDRNWIAYNTINTSNAWATGEIAFAIGLINVNGQRNGILGNTFTGGFLGSFISDKDGIYIGNEMYGNAIGALLCKVTPIIFPDRTVHFAEYSCEDWLYLGNSSHDNFNTGYLVIDGANDNKLQGNKAANNAAYDIELAGVSERFGFTTPESFNNRVVARENLTVKDCGNGNTVIGGIAIDTAADPCF